MPAEIISISLVTTPSEYDQLKMIGDKTFQKSFVENVLEEARRQLKYYSDLRDQGYQIDHVELIETSRGKELFFLLYLPGEKISEPETFMPASGKKLTIDDIPF